MSFFRDDPDDDDRSRQDCTGQLDDQVDFGAFDGDGSCTFENSSNEKALSMQEITSPKLSFFENENAPTAAPKVARSKPHTSASIFQTTAETDICIEKRVEVPVYKRSSPAPIDLLPSKSVQPRPMLQSPKRNSASDPFANLPKVLFTSPPIVPRTPALRGWQDSNPLRIQHVQDSIPVMPRQNIPVLVRGDQLQNSAENPIGVLSKMEYTAQTVTPSRFSNLSNSSLQIMKKGVEASVPPTSRAPLPPPSTANLVTPPFCRTEFSAHSASDRCDKINEEIIADVSRGREDSDMDCTIAREDSLFKTSCTGLANYSNAPSAATHTSSCSGQEALQKCSQMEKRVEDIYDRQKALRFAIEKKREEIILQWKDLAIQEAKALSKDSVALLAPQLLQLKISMERIKRKLPELSENHQ